MRLQKDVVYPVAAFIDPWLGDKVNSGIGLSYRPASHVALRASRQPYAGADLVPQSGIIEMSQNVRFQNVRFQNVRFQNVRFQNDPVYKTSGLQNVKFQDVQFQNVRFLILIFVLIKEKV